MRIEVLANELKSQEEVWKLRRFAIASQNARGKRISFPNSAKRVTKS